MLGVHCVTCMSHRRFLQGLKGLGCFIQGQKQEEDWKMVRYRGTPVGMRQRCSHKQLREKETVCNTKNGTKKMFGLKKKNKPQFWNKASNSQKCLHNLPIFH